MTPAEAQVELQAVADQLLAIEDRLREVWEAVRPSPDEDEMSRVRWRGIWRGRFGRLSNVGEELRRAIESLERVSHA